jgi:hypothetical protein
MLASQSAKYVPAAAAEYTTWVQMVAFSRENGLKYAVLCAQRGENLATYTETS